MPKLFMIIKTQITYFSFNRKESKTEFIKYSFSFKAFIIFFFPDHQKIRASTRHLLCNKKNDYEKVGFDCINRKKGKIAISKVERTLDDDST